jgi:hypothetical protein
LTLIIQKSKNILNGQNNILNIRRTLASNAIPKAELYICGVSKPGIQINRSPTGAWILNFCDNLS